ncbi:hypothetical protein ACFLVO_02135 [Chloroflexota bacterium]
MAVNNPEKLPLAFLELIKQRLIPNITNRLMEVVEASFNDFEKKLRKELSGAMKKLDK